MLRQYYTNSNIEGKVTRIYHQHPAALLTSIGPGIGLIAVLIAGQILAQNTNWTTKIPTVYLILIIILYLIVTTFTIIVGWYSYSRTEVLITDKYIIHIDQFGFFNRKISQLEINRIQDVRADRKGIWRILFNFGNIIIETAGESQYFKLQNLPLPEKIAEDLIEIIEQAKPKSLNTDQI